MEEEPNPPGKASDEDLEIRFPECERVPYEQIFYYPNGVLRGSVANNYYMVARHTVEQIVKHEALEDIVGVAALYLFRHYLELTLKSIVYNLRRLKTGRQNRPEEDRREVEAIHSLRQFWNEVKNDCPPKVGKKMWRAWDKALVDDCIAAFDEVDANGERFRYHIENGYGVLLWKKGNLVGLRCPNLHKLQVHTTQPELANEVFRCMRCYEEEERKARETKHSFDQDKTAKFKVRDRLNPLAVSWPALLSVMDQAHSVLEAIDSYLIETYFQNEEWEQEQNSWQ
jgi:hypothetical protein